jgi:hypothetical protein
MAGDWIKMRPSLLTSPKINGIARVLESDARVSAALLKVNNGVMGSTVTRYVTRCVTVTALLALWGAANEHTSNGVFTNVDPRDIDDMAGVPGFCDALESVGWAIYDEENSTVTLPNFNEYNTSGKDRVSGGAERQRRYRERKSSKSDALCDVTRYVTSDEREEKRREEKKEQKQPPDKPVAVAKVDLPSWIDGDAWSGFAAMRRKERHPLTERATGLIVKKLETLRGEGFDPSAILDQSTRNGWRDVFPIKADAAKSHSKTPDYLVGAI